MNTDTEIPSDSKNTLDMVSATLNEYQLLAHKIGTTPLAKVLVMRNGMRVGWKSNRRYYVSPVAYKVASGSYPKNYSGKG